MNKFKFYKEKKNNPESRIGQRTWKYQKARDELSKVLGTGSTYEEKMEASMNYIIEKTFSSEPLSESDLYRREYTVAYLWKKQDIEEVMEKINDKLRVYADRVNDDVENKWKTPNSQDLKAYIAGKELLDYVAEKHDAPIEGVPALGPHVQSFAHKIGIDLDGSIVD